AKRFLREDYDEGLRPGQGFTHFSIDSKFAQRVLSGLPVIGLQNLSQREPVAEEQALFEDILRMREEALEMEESEEEEEDDDEDEDEEDD
ncbi:unnamed protein product, partial [Heterosigma akashiwo]